MTSGEEEGDQRTWNVGGGQCGYGCGSGAGGQDAGGGGSPDAGEEGCPGGAGRMDELVRPVIRQAALVGRTLISF